MTDDAMMISSDTRLIRDTFYSRIFEAASNRPDRFVRNAIKAWQEVMRADFAEFWLHNQHTNAWELLYTTAAMPKAFPISFPDLNPDGSRPIVDFVCDKTEVLTNVGLENTLFAGNGSLRYSVANKEVFSRLGFPRFDAVPLIAEDEIHNHGHHGDSPPSISIRAAICLHHREDRIHNIHAGRTLNLMARLTGLALLRCFESQQRDVLLSLNGLVERYSPDALKPPRQILNCYLEDLIEVIKKYMRATSVSIFFHDDDRKRIYCAATTGIADALRKVVPKSRLNRCKYQFDEDCWTAISYREGITFVKTPQETSSHPWKYTEYDPHDFDRSLGTMGSVVCPILTPETEPKDTQSTGHRYPALGVIRCSGLKSNYGTERGTINSIGRQTLGLIAQQVGPFIEMLSARIEREEKISCLKHDLFAPLNLIAHTTDRLETDSFLPIAKDRKVKFYDLMNIKSATMLARTMLPQLSLDPGDMTIAPTLVSIENDIIRYLKQMLSHVARIENGMAIKFDPLHAIPELYLDKLSIQRVVFNVIQNAIKYGDQGSVISISARHMPNDYRLSISNYGIGIHQQDEELIFEIGFRSSKAKTHCQGTGNGLYVAQKAMRLHRGHIELKKRAEPTIFDLVFPSLLRTNDWWRRD